MCFHIRSCINLAISLEMCVFGVQVLISILGVVDGFGGAAGGLLVVGGLLAAILAAGRGLLALVGGCWRSAGGLLASFGGLLAAFWRLAGGSWRFYWHSWRHYFMFVVSGFWNMSERLEYQGVVSIPDDVPPPQRNHHRINVIARHLNP